MPLRFEELVSLAEQNAEIERLRKEREELVRELNDAEANLGDNALRRALAAQADIERIARVDERRVTAERIAKAIEDYQRPWHDDPAILDTAQYAARQHIRIAREIGGAA